MKKILFLLIFSPTLLFAYPSVSKDLKPLVDTLWYFPESQEVLKKVEQKGGISIFSSSFNSFSSALWNGTDREIVLNSSSRRSRGEKMRSILFELHNALADEDFIRIDKMAASGTLSKEDYVEMIERLEYKNALETKQIIDRGIAQGYFPKDMVWPIFTNFEDHFNMQLQTGHSKAIAALYESIRANTVR